MQITSVNFPASADIFGLPELKLDGLGKLVLVAGANGSGKTRLLRTLEMYLQRKPTPEVVENAHKQITQMQANIDKELSRIDVVRDRYKEAEIPEKAEAQVQQWYTNIETWQQNKKRQQDIIEWNYLTTDEDADKYEAVFAIPTSVHLTDDRINRPRDSNRFAKSVSDLGIAGLKDGTLPYIKKVSDRYFNSTHHEVSVKEEEQIAYTNSYEELKRLVTLFLGAPLERNAEGYPSLFGKVIADSNLSAGQTILLQLCVQIHAQNAELNNVVLLLDEPENHLHPAACLELIDTIRSAAPNSQIWIATHSLPILANLTDDSTLLFADDGRISYAGSVPEKVLRQLVGDEDVVAKIRDFTSLPEIYALNRFTAECLLPPGVVGANDGDDQTLQIQQHINVLSKRKSKLRILDWGAGKGRLLENLHSMDPAISDRIDYMAFDPYPEDAEDCKSAISRVYGDSANRYFSTIEQVAGTIDSNSVNLVVMCNVLHEISPSKWRAHFGKKGKIAKLLSEDGYLLVVEDEQIPMGEIAHEFGFIVLGPSEIKDLFLIKEVDVDFAVSDQRNDGRLMAFLIPNACMIRITQASVSKALETKHVNSADRIRKLRKDSGRGYKTGRILAFWLQQYANSALALEEV